MDRITASAELSAIADGLDRYHQRIAAIVTSLGTGPEKEAMSDLLSSLHEVERTLKSSGRGLQRALKLLG
jgi:hypothetical protein